MYTVSLQVEPTELGPVEVTDDIWIYNYLYRLDSTEQVLHVDGDRTHSPLCYVLNKNWKVDNIQKYINCVNRLQLQNFRFN